MCIIVNTWVGKGVVNEQDLAKDTVHRKQEMH